MEAERRWEFVGESAREVMVSVWDRRLYEMEWDEREKT